MNLRTNKTAAYVGPFMAYMVLQSLVNFIKVDNPLLPWWKAGPEHWVYPLQVIVCLGLIAYWWKQYDFKPLTKTHVILGISTGILGIILWLIPSMLSLKYGWQNEWLGMVSRDKDGYDPTILEHTPAAYWTSLILRFVRMTIAVAILEELMMRGFLWRYLANPDGDFWKVPIGIWRPLAVGGSIAAFTFGHHIPDLLACLIYGILISWLAWKTKSLGACVICHGVSNFILGLYIMQTKQFGLW